MLTFTGLHPFASPRSHRARTTSANPLDAPESGDKRYRIGSINQLQGSSSTLHSGATAQFTCFAGTKVQILTQKAPTETRTHEGERRIWRTSSEGDRFTGGCPSYVRRRITADHPDGNDGEDGEECRNPFSLTKAWHKERATALIADIIQNQAEKERERRSDLCCLTIHVILVLLYISVAQRARYCSNMRYNQKTSGQYRARPQGGGQ
jgi:hypothetical protein